MVQAMLWLLKGSIANECPSKTSRRRSVDKSALAGFSVINYKCNRLLREMFKVLHRMVRLSCWLFWNLESLYRLLAMACWVGGHGYYLTGCGKKNKRLWIVALPDLFMSYLLSIHNFQAVGTPSVINMVTLIYEQNLEAMLMPLTLLFILKIQRTNKPKALYLHREPGGSTSKATA